MENKRFELMIIKIILIVSTLIFSSSCTTGMLWDRDFYIERINSIYIDNNSFIALGESYHYIFKVDKDFIGILKSSKNIKMRPVFYSFDLTPNNNLSGKIGLYLYKNDITHSEENYLKKLGFKNLTDNALKYEVVLKGTRYKPKPNQKIVRNLSKTYNIKILMPRDDGIIKTSGKILLTPITFTADVALGFAAGILYGVTFKWIQT